MNEFLKYKENIYSQHGEDGIIREILKRLNNKFNNYKLINFICFYI